MVRYHRMKGRPTLWLPGTDHAGIATQVCVCTRNFCSYIIFQPSLLFSGMSIYFPFIPILYIIYLNVNKIPYLPQILCIVVLITFFYLSISYQKQKKLFYSEISC